MGDLISKVKNNITQLRTALSQRRDPQIDRAVSALERNLLDNQAYQSIWDERLLAEAYHFLSRSYGKDVKQQLNGLHQHLAIVRSVHDNMYAILDPNIELGELLFLYLDNWSQLLDRPVECRFGNNTKNKLHEARQGDNTEQTLDGFLAAYFGHLRAEDLNDVTDILEPAVEAALAGYKRVNQWSAHGLFVTPDNRGEVRGLRIRPEAEGEGQIRCLNDDIGPDLKTAAKCALSCVETLWPHTRSWDFKWEIEGGEVAFTGKSIGLALTMGILAEVESFDIDTYTAFTGYVEWATGEIRQVEYLDAKLRAAKELGIRRVFIPKDNTDDVYDIKEIEIIPVASVGEAKEWFRSRNYDHANTPIEQLATARIREMEVELKAQGIQMVDCVQRESYCKRVVFTDYHNEVFVDVFHGKRGLTPQVQRSRTGLRGVVQEVSNRVFGAKPSDAKSGQGKRRRKNYTVSARTDQERVENYILNGRDDSIRESEKNCIYRAKIVGANQTVFVRQYSSGTLTIDGPPGSLFEEVDQGVRAVLGVSEMLPSQSDEGGSRLSTQVEAVEAVELGERWIGTDESGKGDYFGPLVGAAVMIDEQTEELLREIGVKDSKRLSDKRVLELAVQIRQVCGKRAVIVTIPPERYNPLYEQFRSEGKNLNTLLAWAHTRALEDILTEFPQEQITVLVDKFADESYIQSKLLEKGRRTDLNLAQLPKAEANIAVAAASVLARAQFLQWLERLSRQYGVDLPKGASDPRIIPLGKKIVARYGEDGLSKVAKLHFKTTKRILTS